MSKGKNNKKRKSKENEKTERESQEKLTTKPDSNDSNDTGANRNSNINTVQEVIPEYITCWSLPLSQTYYLIIVPELNRHNNVIIIIISIYQVNKSMQLVV